MEKVFSATEARIHLGQVLSEVQNGPVFIERAGRVEAVVLSARTYAALTSGLRPPAWGDLVSESRRQVTADLAGRALPPPADMLYQLYEERDEKLDRLH